MSIDLDEASTAIIIQVVGHPAPGGSKNIIPRTKDNRYTGKFSVIDAGGVRNKQWRHAVREAAVALGVKPLAGPLLLMITFRMQRPKSHYRTVQGAQILRPDAPHYPVYKPDLTKLLRSTEDALTGVAWIDDSQVCAHTNIKLYTNDSSPTPGAEIKISQLTPWLE